MSTKTIFSCVIFIALIGIWYFQMNKGISTQQISGGISSAPTAVLGQQTKTANCVSQGALPDKDCTPGSIFQTATKDDICRLGYTKSVRNVPQEEKNQVYAAYGITSHHPGEYEVDHLISLELGGSNDIANLWPEP